MKINIINNNSTNYSIVIPDNFEETEMTAASELQKYLEKVFGIKLNIINESQNHDSAIYVGHTNYAQTSSINTNSKENWIIKMHGSNLVLKGGLVAGDRGTLYSVYHFLEDIVGIRWWNKWKEYIPDISSLSLEDDFCIEATPTFSYRKVLSHMNIDNFYYQVRNRENVVMPDDGLEDEACNKGLVSLGGAKHMGRPDHSHTLPLYIPPNEYFEDHPEWFAWDVSKGEHVPYAHYCLTNEGLFEEILKKLTSYIEDDMAIAKEKNIETPCFYSISFPDVIQGFCQCEKCRKIEEKAGPSGYALYFVNKLARAVSEKYPHVKIETLMYSIYIDPPKDDTIPEKNVVIRLAQVYVDIIHSINDKGNRWYLSLLKDWSKICKKAGCDLHIWEYMYNLFFDFPMPVACRLGETFRAFYDYGVKGVFVENEVITASLWELNQYLLVHLTENPYANDEKLIDDFMTKFYGKASEYMKAYLYELNSCAKRNECSAYCVIESAHFNYLDVQTVIKCYKLLANAYEAIKDDPYLSMKVKWEQKLLLSQILIKYSDLKNMAAKQGLKFDFNKDNLRLEILKTLELVKNSPNFTNVPSWLDDEIKFYSEFDTECEDSADIPEELSEENKDDIYQFYFKNLARHLHDAKNYGFSIQNDEKASLGKVAVMCRQDALVEGHVADLFVTSRNAASPRPISISIEQNAKIIGGLNLYLEDIVADEYKLYKIGSVSNIKESSETRVNIFGLNYEWFSLLGLSTVFPVDSCDIYMSMKFTGVLYGGSKNDKDAVFADRIIVVRKGEN